LKNRDKSGKISADEMKQVFVALGLRATDQEIKAVIKEMDTNSRK